MESRLVSSLRAHKNYVSLGVCCGWSWIVCCCIGLVCLIPAKEIESVLGELRDVIAWYSADTLNRLAPRVRAQHDLFITACSHVNAKAAKIFPNTNLIDAICAFNTTLDAIVNDKRTSLVFFNCDREAKKKYMLDVYNEYIRLGGNTAPIIYGLPEYLAIVYDPTCDIMVRYYRDIVKPTQLNRLVLDYKTLAGF